MSGGSYNYLYSKDPIGLFSAADDLDYMRKRLEELGYAKDALMETQQLIQLMHEYELTADSKMEKLRDIFDAVEWWDSCDSGEEGVKEALEKYRKKKS